MALGEFIDEQLQEHGHDIVGTAGNTAYANVSDYGYGASGKFASGEGIWQVGANFSVLRAITVRDARIGTTTEVKAVGMNFIIRY